jgi:hypothetical protein
MIGVTSKLVLRFGMFLFCYSSSPQGWRQNQANLHHASGNSHGLSKRFWGQWASSASKFTASLQNPVYFRSKSSQIYVNLRQASHLIELNCVQTFLEAVGICYKQVEGK